MSESDEDLATLVAELVRAVRELQSELSDGRGPALRPPRPRDLLQVTSEVAIPATILVLETNVRALRLLQRAIRLADRERDANAAEGPVSDRAVAATDRTLSRLDDALDTLADALEGQPNDEAARELLDEVRHLRSEVQQRLDDPSAHVGGEEGRTRATDAADGQDSAGGEGETDHDHVEVDVEAELDAIKSELDDRESQGAGPPQNGTDGDDAASDEDAVPGDGEDASSNGDDVPDDDADAPTGGE